MNSQVIFKIDKKLKDKAMAKAQSEGVAFSAVLKLATKAFINGDLQVGLIEKNKFNTETAKQVKKILKEVDQKKNISKGFLSGSEIAKFLKS